MDVDLKHESTILNKEYAHMKLGLRLSPEVELDIGEKTPEDILQGEYPTVQFIFRKLGTGTNTNYGLK